MQKYYLMILFWIDLNTVDMPNRITFMNSSKDLLTMLVAYHPSYFWAPLLGFAVHAYLSHTCLKIVRLMIKVDHWFDVEFLVNSFNSYFKIYFKL